MPQRSHPRIPLHGLLTRERQNVKMLAREQLVSYSCLFFLLKKPLNVEVLSSPHKKSREHHRSPGFQGRGRRASFPTEKAASWLQETVIVQAASSVVSNNCLGSKSVFSRRVCARDSGGWSHRCVCRDPACLNVQSVRCDYGFPSPWNVWVTVGPSPHQEVTRVSCQELGQYLFLETSLQCWTANSSATVLGTTAV